MIEIRTEFVVRRWLTKGGHRYALEANVIREHFTDVTKAVDHITKLYRGDLSVLCGHFFLNGFEYEFEGEPCARLQPSGTLVVDSETKKWALNRIEYCLNFHRAFYGEKRYYEHSARSEDHRTNAL
jgi:hypothetical protein